MAAKKEPLINSRFPDRLTRDSRVSDHFLVKKSRKIRKICFLDSRDPNKILNFLRSFNMTSISYINPYFLAPSPLKPLNSSSRYQNLPGESVTAHSDHWGPLSDPIYPPKCCFFDLFSPLLTFVRLM